MKIGRLRAAAICGALGIFVSATTLGPAKAATLLADGTLNVANDLTRINNGGTVLEFLDLTVTNGAGEAGALIDHPGFTLATEAQVIALFDAFGIAYISPPPNDFVVLSPDPANVVNFVSHLGATNIAAGPASLGKFDAGGFSRSYFCIGCAAAGSFVYNIDVTGGGIGITLVRAGDIGSTPLPAALPLFAGGLGLIGLLARHRKRKAAAVA